MMLVYDFEGEKFCTPIELLEWIGVSKATYKGSGPSYKNKQSNVYSKHPSVVISQGKVSVLFKVSKKSCTDRRIISFADFLRGKQLHIPPCMIYGTGHYSE